MTWFATALDETAADARGGLVRVLSKDGTATAGAGVYLAGRSLLTCAHVVNSALGLRVLNPGDPGNVVLDVAFPVLSAAHTWLARLTAWIPPRSKRQRAITDGTLRWDGDLAVLELEGDPPTQVGPLRWLEMEMGQQVRAWYGGGQAFSYADVRVASYGDGVGYLDGQLSGAAIGEGYSGGPLWSVADRAAVGLVMGRIDAPDTAFAAQHTVRRSWGRSWQSVMAELRRAGAVPEPHLAALGAGPAAFGVDESVRDMLVGPLHILLGDPAARAAHAGALAVQLGLRAPVDGSAPSVEELAQLLGGTERALPTLAESLSPTVADDPRGRVELDRLLAVGRVTDAARLLSVAEHRVLLAKLEHLAVSDPGLLHRAANAALPYLDLPRSLQTTRLSPSAVPGVLRELETWHGDGSPVPEETPRLPALLRVVEYVAAETGGLACQALQEWGRRVSTRLGVHASALHERRADAERWSRRTAPAGSRILVELDQYAKDPAGHYRCSVWRVRPDGSAARAVTGTERPRTGKEIAHLIRDAADSTDDGVAMVAVSVPPDALELPVDEWDGAGADEVIPAPLGEDFHLVLRCPKLRTRSRTGDADLKRRWRARAQSPPLVADHTVGGRAGLIGLLKTTHRDGARVYLQGSPEHRGELLPICLVMGVPIVLWDREDRGGRAEHHSGPDGGPPLTAVVAEGPVDELPERLRHFRARGTAYSAGAARPSLVWEDAGLPLPDELRLADPSRGTEQAI
ncbi:serine protease [Streptomyces sp. NBC_01381]|uniref:VMAP-C domain-containing protein n=1 Tax=Streptomyces sp. NBC_01381 TaxID=2903845 RepID=UPI0022542086|nr:trypsin-like peptidase domain-containing protein [Streptomyces sp. NBC_01381]MCX4671833.1 serine protease [Streptomyces sp. NBC_01381]